MLSQTLLRLIITGSLSVSSFVCAANLSLESGPGKTHLLELYTSEGCSSCPPAEAWLSKLKDDGGLWRNFVPVAFHVDYWEVSLADGEKVGAPSLRQSGFKRWRRRVAFEVSLSRFWLAGDHCRHRHS
jgi:hypothetical protein